MTLVLAPPTSARSRCARRLGLAGGVAWLAAAVVPAPLPPPFTGLRCSDNLALGLGPLDFLWLDFLDGLGCPPAPRLEFPLAGYEGTQRRHYGDVHEPSGVVEALREFATQYPGMPLFITENGFGFRDGTEPGGGRVRARSLVRHVEAIHEAVADPTIDVRGYFHWTLMDNYEWNSGNRYRIGLYRVDYDTFERSPTEAVGVYERIASDGVLERALRDEYGGDGPLFEGL